MAWVRIDDKIRNHPKFLRAGPVASWLWLCGQSYCADYLTDGFIPAEALESLGSVRRAKHHAAALVAAGLWDEVDGGFQVHDYHEYQPSKDEVLALRDIRAFVGKLGGRKSGDVRRSKRSKPGSNEGSKLVRQNEANGEPKSNPVPVPVPMYRK